MENITETSKIVEFFRNSTIFLTGGTGFVGKVLMNKLLSTCEVSCIYLLIRKKSSSSAERFQELFDDPIFIPLKNKFPDFENRVKLVEGDCSLENLGLSANDEEILCKSVDFVIHCAAAMNMMGSFKTSVEINIYGTLQLVNLANKMVNLKTFVHLSSLAGFWDQDTVEEKLYESHLEYEDCLNLLKIDHILPMDKYDKKKITGDKLTIYSLTKSDSENIFTREKISFPVVIFRFSIAGPCWKEPVRGWTAGFYGPNGLVALSILGIAPIVYCKDTSINDFIPVDLIVNALLAATQHSYDKFQKTKEYNEESTPDVYNYSGKNYENAITIENCMRYAKREFTCIPTLYSNKVAFWFWSVMIGYIPALLIDLFATLFRKKLRIGAFQTYDELVDANLSMVVVNWHQPVKNDNLENCWKNLNDIDKELFSFDLNKVDWEKCAVSVSNYARKYLHTQVEKDKRMRLAVFWIPKIRLAFKVLLYFVPVVWSSHFLYAWLLQN